MIYDIICLHFKVVHVETSFYSKQKKNSKMLFEWRWIFHLQVWIEYAYIAFDNWIWVIFGYIQLSFFSKLIIRMKMNEKRIYSILSEYVLEFFERV